MIARILRFFPPFKGKQRLSRWLLAGEMKSLHDKTVKGKFGCRYLLPNIIENVGFDIYVDGIFEGDVIEFIRRRLSKNALWVDVGANIGSISIPVSILRPDTRVLCIEASPRVFHYLRHNRSLNNTDQMILVNRAMTDQNDQEVNFFSPEDKFGKGSLVSVFTQKAETVRTITLDHLLRSEGWDPVEFMKVDVEGFEYMVFKGGASVLSSPQAPDILFEFIDSAELSAPGLQPGDAQRLLISYGYQLYTFGKAGHLKKMDGAMSADYSLIFASKKPNIL